MPERQSFNKAHIVFLTMAYPPLPPAGGGAEKMVQEIVNRCQNRFSFTAVTIRWKRSEPEHEVIDGADVFRLGFPGRAGFVLWAFAAAWRAARLKPNLVHASLESYPGLALLLFRILRPRTPTLLTLQAGIVPKGVWHKLGFRLVRLFLAGPIQRLPHQLTALSRALAERAVKFGVSRERVLIIPNGVELNRIPAEPSSGRKPRSILTVARLAKEKGLDFLISAFAEVKKEFPDATLDVIGYGPQEQLLRSQIAESNLSDSIKLLGAMPHEEVLRRMCSSELFVLPSLFEAQGIVLVEARACGIPIVATKVGGIPDVIADGQTGLLVPPADAKALAQAITQLLQDKVLAKRLAKNALQNLEPFSWQKIIDEYAHVYEMLLRKNPRVLIATGIYPPDIGGPATFSELMAEAMETQGWEVAIMSYGEKGTDDKQKNVTRISRNIPKGLRHLLYFFSLFFKAGGAKIIFAQDCVATGLSALLVAKLRGKALIVKVVGDYAWERAVSRFEIKELLDEFLKKRYGFFVETLRLIERFVAKKADLVITPSEYLRSVVEQWGVKPNLIRVIPNGIKLDLPKISKWEARANLKIKKEEIVIVSIGRLVRWKGFELLVRLMTEIRKQFPNSCLYIIGDGSEKMRLENIIKELKLGDAVRLIGTLPHKAIFLWLAAADLFCLNTGYEGFSHQILEAMAAGTAIISTQEGGNKEILRDKENALVARYNDEVRWKEAILLALKDEALRKRISQRAKQTASQFSESRMIADYIQIFEKIMTIK